MTLSAAMFVFFVGTLALLELQGHTHPVLWFMVGVWILFSDGLNDAPKQVKP